MSLQLNRRIKHPDWVITAHHSIFKSADLYASGKIPATIQVFMVVTPVRHLLRGVYGSDIKAAMALLGQALNGSMERMNGHVTRFWRYRICMKSQERDMEEMMDGFDGPS